MDAFTRECLVLEVDTSLPSRRVALERVIEQRGTPELLGSDNEPEVSGRHHLA
jgi:putative transposase